MKETNRNRGPRVVDPSKNVPAKRTARSKSESRSNKSSLKQLQVKTGRATVAPSANSRKKAKAPIAENARAVLETPKDFIVADSRHTGNLKSNSSDIDPDSGEYDEGESTFKYGITEQIGPDGQSIWSHPLEKFSLRGSADELKKLAIDPEPFLGKVALMGQSTVWFAQGNTGKTLIALRLLTEAIQQGRVNPSMVYYFNMDDSGKGLEEKSAIADEVGFHMISDGFNGFRTKDFLPILTQLVEGDQARGVVIILDTIKKIVNVMQKTEVSEFTSVVRQFTKAGGTLIAMAHTNKRPGYDGKPIPGGTSDIKDDFDCVYLMSRVRSKSNTTERMIRFENDKKRGNSIQRVSYTYSIESGISYNELLDSVREIDEGPAAPKKQAKSRK